MPQEQETPYAVVGAGFSGTCIVIGLLIDEYEKGYKGKARTSNKVQVALIDPSPELLPSNNTSNVQPGRTTAGYHYGHVATAIKCVEPMIKAITETNRIKKAFSDEALTLDDFVGATQNRDEDDRNTKYIPADESSADKLHQVSDAIQKEFERAFNTLRTDDKALIRRLFPSWDKATTSTESHPPPIFARIMPLDKAQRLQQAGLIPSNAMLDRIIETREMQSNIPRLYHYLQTALHKLQAHGLLKRIHGRISKISQNEERNTQLTVRLHDHTETPLLFKTAVCAAYENNISLHHDLICKQRGQGSNPQQSTPSSPPLEGEREEELSSHLSSATPPLNITSRFKAVISVKVTPKKTESKLPSQMMVYTQENALMVTPYHSESGNLYKATVGCITNLGQCELVSGRHQGRLSYTAYKDNPVYSSLSAGEKGELDEALMNGHITETFKGKIGLAITAQLKEKITAYDFELINTEVGAVMTLGGSELQTSQNPHDNTPSIHTRTQTEVVEAVSGRIYFYYTIKAMWLANAVNLGKEIATKNALLQDILPKATALLGPYCTPEQSAALLNESIRKGRSRSGSESGEPNSDDFSHVMENLVAHTTPGVFTRNKDNQTRLFTNSEVSRGTSTTPVSALHYLSQVEQGELSEKTTPDFESPTPNLPMMTPVPSEPRNKPPPKSPPSPCQTNARYPPLLSPIASNKRRRNDDQNYENYPRYGR